MKSKRIAAAVGVLFVLVACGGSSEPRAAGSSAPIRSATPDNEPEDGQPADPCAEYPPPFKASYLPEGIKKKLERGQACSKERARTTPQKGCVGTTGAQRTRFTSTSRPAPGRCRTHRRILTRCAAFSGRRGEIGKIEGSWAVEFSLDDCDFRMDTYGIDRAETVKVAKGLHEKS